MSQPSKGPAKKRPKLGSPAGINADALIAAANGAIKVLSDPKVRQQLIDFGSGLSDSVRARNEARRAAHAADAGEKDAGPRPHVLRQRRLERRADRLSENLELLRLAPGPESAAALKSVSEVVGRIRLALAIANNLPLRRRVQAQREIAVTLTRLEEAVLEATMPSTEEPSALSDEVQAPTESTPPNER